MVKKKMLLVEKKHWHCVFQRSALQCADLKRRFLSTLHFVNSCFLSCSAADRSLLIILKDAGLAFQQPLSEPQKLWERDREKRQKKLWPQDISVPLRMLIPVAFPCENGAISHSHRKERRLPAPDRSSQGLCGALSVL